MNISTSITLEPSSLRELADLIEQRQAIDERIQGILGSSGLPLHADAPANAARAVAAVVSPSKDALREAVQPALAVGKPAVEEANPETAKKRASRGSVSRDFIAVLEAAPPAGISVGFIVDTLKKSPQQVRNWLSVRGRKTPGYERVSPGRYRIVASKKEKK